MYSQYSGTIKTCMIYSARRVRNYDHRSQWQSYLFTMSMDIPTISALYINLFMVQHTFAGTAHCISPLLCPSAMAKVPLNFWSKQTMHIKQDTLIHWCQCGHQFVLACSFWNFHIYLHVWQIQLYSARRDWSAVHAGAICTDTASNIQEAM